MGYQLPFPHTCSIKDTLMKPSILINCIWKLFYHLLGFILLPSVECDYKRVTLPSGFGYLSYHRLWSRTHWSWWGEEGTYEDCWGVVWISRWTACQVFITQTSCQVQTMCYIILGSCPFQTTALVFNTTAFASVYDMASHKYGSSEEENLLLPSWFWCKKTGFLLGDQLFRI